MEKASRVDLLVEAIHCLSKFRNKTIVVKLGGSAMDLDTPFLACLQDLLLLQRAGLKVILVHGGGKAIDQAMVKSGLQPKKIAGRRFTDDATLKIVAEVLLNETNSGIVKRIGDLGGKAAPLHSGSLQALWGSKWRLDSEVGQVDLGHVGQIDRVDCQVIQQSLLAGEIPVIPSLAEKPEGGLLNVNADTCACAVASAMKASSLVFLSDTPGILRDRNNPSSLISQLNEKDCQDLIASKVIDTGMIPKVESCLESLKNGVGSARMIDGRANHSLLLEFTQNQSTGTVITL
ncbi:MAG: acetylglutamate kinase [Gemmataceae bacterium]|nr:acetylglutamate kinase [Gemmataceae bacterium]